MTCWTVDKLLFWWMKWKETKNFTIAQHNRAIVNGMGRSREKIQQPWEESCCCWFVVTCCVCMVEFLRCARDFQSKEPLALGSMNSTIDSTSGETLSTIEQSIGYVCSRARSQNVLRCDVVANLWTHQCFTARVPISHSRACPTLINDMTQTAGIP